MNDRIVRPLVACTRSLTTLILAAAVSTGVAHAQTVPARAADDHTGYIEAVGQSAFGNVTSQSYGAEAGVTVWNNLQVFGEVGRIRSVAPPELGARALVVAAFLSQTQTGVTVSVKEPVTFGAVGLRYVIPITGAKVQPYVLGGVGLAKVTRDVAFAVGGTDVTGQLTSFGVVVGSDLAGEFRKPMLTLGGGVAWPIWQQLVLDFQFRFSRISPEDDVSAATTVSRAGLGFGIRF